jgi:hypothetical protein
MARSELAAAVVKSFLAGLEDLDRRRATYERLTQIMQPAAPADAAVAGSHAQSRAGAVAPELPNESARSV